MTLAQQSGPGGGNVASRRGPGSTRFLASSEVNKLLFGVQAHVSSGRHDDKAQLGVFRRFKQIESTLVASS